MAMPEKIHWNKKAKRVIANTLYLVSCLTRNEFAQLYALSVLKILVYIFMRNVNVGFSY